MTAEQLSRWYTATRLRRACRRLGVVSGSVFRFWVVLASLFLALWAQAGDAAVAEYWLCLQISLP